MSTAEQDVVLITSAIGSPPLFLKITNHEERLHQTLCGLVCWIREPSARTIVLCDGTMTPFDFSKVARFAEEHGKTFEALLFQESDNFMKHGKGYAEGEVLEHALNHSKHLSDGGSFYKVTGRTFVANFDDIKKAHAGDAAVFYGPAWALMPDGGHEERTHVNLSSRIEHARAMGLGTLSRVLLARGKRLAKNALTRGEWSTREHDSVWTQFFKCDVAFFRRHLLKVYERVDDLYNNIEHEYHRTLRNVPYTKMAIRPRVVGRNAGYGLVYDEDYSDEVQAVAKSLR